MFPGNRGDGAANSRVIEGLGRYLSSMLHSRQPKELLQQRVQCLVVAFGKGLEPFHKTTKKLLVPTNGGYLGGEGVAELV